VAFSKLSPAGREDGFLASLELDHFITGWPLIVISKRG
jgi:hypothetical protein